MKKIQFIIILVALAIFPLSGCSNNGAYSRIAPTDAVVENTTQEELNKPVEVTQLAKETKYIDGFEIAEYSKFNSYASENGLGGTYVYIEGKVLNQTKLTDTKTPLVALIVEQTDNNRWCVAFPSENKLNIATKENVKVFGVYGGYSDVFNLPAINLSTKNSEKIRKIRIEVQENGQWVTAWSFLDYVNNTLSKEESKTEPENQSATQGVSTKEAQPEPTQQLKQEKKPTLGEQNALKKAESYLKYSSFSYSGLVSQLEYEGYSHEEAIYGVDNCNADWNEQAAAKAASYLKYSSFSRQGLIDQLKFEGFTDNQTEYGVTAVGY